MIQIKRWAQLEPWNPASPKQVLQYLQHKNYKIPKDRKTGKPTTNEEALKSIYEKNPEDPVLPILLDARHLKHAVGDLKDAALGRDGRFHSLFTYRPDTGRLASQRPNLNNRPQGREGGIEFEIAVAVSSIIEADPGKVLLSPDWKAIEAVLTGWFANDPGYIRLSLLDSHGFYTSHILAHRGAPITAFKADDLDLEEKLIWLKKNYPKERALGKMINLATGYGMGARHLAAKVKCSLPEAATFLRLKDEMAPKVAQWKKETQMRAHKEGKLTNPFGYTRAFFGVYERKPNGEWKLGREANEALAFLPQSTAAAMLRDSLVEMDGRLGDLADLLVPVHDAVLLQCVPAHVPEVVALVREIMEREWPELNGFSVKTDWKVGLNWAPFNDDQKLGSLNLDGMRGLKLPLDPTVFP